MLVILTIAQITSINEMEKVSLPIKTKIAGYSLIVSGIILLGMGYSLIRTTYGDLLGLFFLIVSGLSFFFSYRLFEKKKRAWVRVFILLLINFISGLIAFFPLCALRIYPPPQTVEIFCLFYQIFIVWLFIFIILFLLDRKNFWKIAT